MAKTEELNDTDEGEPKKEEEEEKPKNNDLDEEEEEGDGKKKRRRKRKRSRKSKGEEDGDDEEEDVNTSDDDTKRTVFIEGIPYDGTPEQVAECLQNHTGISNEDITDLRFPKWQDTGRMRGYGHIAFSSVDVFEKVMKVAKSGEKIWMGKRYLSIQPAKPQGMGLVAAAQQPVDKEPTTTIMIKNLDYNATEEDIIKVMEKFGNMIEGGVRIARNFQTRQNKGFAYVEYEDISSSKKAMERQKKNPKKPLYILNRPCLLDYDEGRIKGSFKTSSGRLWSKEYKDSHKKQRGS
mgnify:CR=1 FL=1